MCVYLGGTCRGTLFSGVESGWFKYVPTWLYVCTRTLCTPGRVNGEGKRVLEIKKVIR